MPRLLVRRLLVAVVTLLGLSILLFVLVEVLPGDSLVYSITGPFPSQELLDATRERLGLDQPAAQRYLNWIGNTLRGDLGVSLIGGRPVAELILDRLGNTVILAGLGFAIMVPLSLALGVWGGTREGQRTDKLVSMSTLTVIAVPEFVLGALLVVLLAFTIPLFPPTSLISAGISPLADPSKLVLPVLTLSLITASYAARQVRAGVADVMRTRYVEMARLKGLPERQVIRRHVLPNAIAPSLQVLAATTGRMLGGTVVVETVFGYPGLGSTLAAAVTARDFPVVEAIVLMIAIALLVKLLLADLAGYLLTPRLRTDT